MFKIISKKRYEELKRENELLKVMSSPKTYTIKDRTLDLEANVIMADEMPVDAAKEIIARKLIKEAQRIAIHYDVIDSKDGTGLKILHGMIRVAAK